MSNEGKLNAILVFEVVGRPKEYLVETLKKIIESIGKEKDVEIISEQVKEPVPLKEQDEFYTTFSEVEIQVDSPLNLAILMFKYMPAHIEIVLPERISLSNNDYSEILNELARRLHGYDEIARIIQIENQDLQNKVKELEERISLQDKEKPADKKPLKKISKKNSTKD